MFDEELKSYATMLNEVSLCSQKELRGWFIKKYGEGSYDKSYEEGVAGEAYRDLEMIKEIEYYLFCKISERMELKWGQMDIRNAMVADLETRIKGK